MIRFESDMSTLKHITDVLLLFTADQGSNWSAYSEPYH